MKNILGLCIFSLALLAGCATGKNALKKGDYDKAVMQAISRLRQDTDNEKAIATLVPAYRLALQTHHKNVDAALASPNPFRWERALREYEAIKRLQNELQHCPACLKHTGQPELVTAEITQAREKSAANRYNMAVDALRQKENRLKAIEAHENLQESERLYPGYKDAAILKNEALFYATLKVVIEPIPAPSPLLRLDQEFFNNKINEYLHRTALNPYLRFYTPGEVETENLPWVDHRIVMEFDQFSLGNIISHTEVRELSRDSVLISGSGDKAVYGTVKARFKTHEKAIVGQGLLDFRIVDRQLNKVVAQEKFPSQYRWGITWATYNGDERALSDEERTLVNQRELPIPNPQYMFEEFAAPLYHQTIRKITDYYKDY